MRRGDLVEVVPKRRAAKNALKRRHCGRAADQPSRRIISIKCAAENNDIRVFTVSRVGELLRRIRLNPIIRIEKENILTPRGIKPRIPRARDTAVFLSYKTQAAVMCRRLGNNIGTAIRRAVVDKNRLEVRHCLREQRIYCPSDTFLHIINGKYERDTYHSAPPKIITYAETASLRELK